MATAQSAPAGARGLPAGTRYRALSLRLALVAVGALSATLMLAGLGRRSLWFDETVSVEAAKLPVGDLARYLAATEVNMSLYHALLHVWLWLGDGDAFARSLSVLFGLATLPPLYLLARRLFDVPTAVVAVALIAANVQFVGHAREARSYSLVVLLVTVSSLLLVRAIETGSRRDWRLYALVGALAVYAHLLAGLAVAAQLASLAIVRRGIDMRRAAEAGAILGVLAVPLGASLLLNWQGAQIDWVAAPRAQSLPGLLRWLAGSDWVLAIFIVGGLLACARAYEEWRERRDPVRMWGYVLLAALVAVPPLAAFAISFAKPVYLYRYFLFALPALVVLVAAGLTRLRRAWLVAAVALAATGLSTRTTAECTPACVIGDDDWRAATAHVEAQARPGDGILFVPRELRTTFMHYVPSTERPRLLYPARWPLEGGASEGAATLEDALARAGSSQRVWLVTWWLPTEGVPERLEQARGEPQLTDFEGNVRIRLYGPSTS